MLSSIATTKVDQLIFQRPPKKTNNNFSTYSFYFPNSKANSSANQAY